MNAEFPPLQFQEPQIKSRRRERLGFAKPPAIPAAERSEITQRWLKQKADVVNALRQRSPEERRAIFFRLRHDRPITQKDLAGTDLQLMSTPGQDESLVISKTGALDKLEQRLKKFGEGEGAGRPPGTELATAVQSFEIGNPKDRLSEELVGEFDKLVKKKHVIYEIEVASFARRGAARRKEVRENLEAIRQFLGRGIHGQIYETDETPDGARAVLWSTGAKLRELVESPTWQQRIVFFDARPRFATFSENLQNFNVGQVRIVPPDPASETLCVIDSGIAAGNPFLGPALQAGRSRSFVAGFAPNEDAYGHGSGVASLAAYHHVEIGVGGLNRAEAFVVSARMLTDAGQLDVPQADDDDQDRVRQARLFSRVLREVVEHYRPQGIRIFVLSMQMVGHIWSKATRRLVARNAWVARTIDQLSRDHDVIFVTITGNIAPNDVADLHRDQAYPDYLVHPLAKVFDPGPAALGVTVGSIAHAAKVVGSAHAPMALVDQSSPFTRSGPGFGDANKPDFVEYGGNLVHDPHTGSVVHNAGTNVVMASGRTTPALQHHHGTSFAAPRVAHQFAILSRDLRALGVEAGAPLLRAFLATSAKQPSEMTTLNSADRFSLIGYGIPDGRRATDCSASEAILFWQGTLSVDNTALFRVPVPVEMMEAGRGPKRIVVAVATAPPVQSWGVAEYLGAETKFWLYRGDRDFAKIEALTQREEEENNTRADEGVKNESGEIGITLRSAGSLQCDTFLWSDHKAEYSASEYTVAVSLKGAGWCQPDVLIPTAVVVRIEDSTGKCQQIYAKVKARVQARAKA